MVMPEMPCPSGGPVATSERKRARFSALRVLARSPLPLIPSQSREGDGCCFLCGWRYPERFGRCLSCDNRPTEWCLRAAAIGCASDQGCIAPYGCLYRALLGERFGRCLSCDNCRTVSCRRAAAIDCASDDGCIAPTGAFIVRFWANDPLV